MAEKRCVLVLGEIFQLRRERISYSREKSFAEKEGGKGPFIDRSGEGSWGKKSESAANRKKKLTYG